MSETDLGIDGLADAEEIGAGGFAKVYSATDASFGRTVAVKVLHQLDDGGRRRFERERLTMGRMTGHPNVVVPHSAGYTTAGNPYLLMEYLEGGSLHDQLLSAQTVPWAQAVDWILPIANALEHGHSQGILHRDIKPANILLGVAGTPKLADFGISAIREATSTTQGIAFSLAHAPPETFAGGRDQRDERSDLYSLASTLFELIAGAPPFQDPDANDSQLAYVVRIADHPVPDLADGPPRLNQFLQRALAQSPDARPASAARFTDELQPALELSEQTQTVVAPSGMIRPADDPVRPSQSARNETAPTDQSVPPEQSSSLDRSGPPEADTGETELWRPEPFDVSNQPTQIAPEVRSARRSSAVSRHSRAIILDWAGRPAEALATTNQAIQQDPNDADAHYSQAMALNRLMRHREALESANRAISLDPSLASAYRARSAALRGLGQKAEAKESDSEARKLER